MSDRSTAYRISRLLSVLATLLFVAILIYAGVAVYFATQIRVPARSTAPPTVVGGTTVVLGSNVSIRNPGPFTISDVTIAIHLAFPNGTPWTATTSGPFEIGPYANATLPIMLEVPLGSLTGPAAGLLVHDAKLPDELWANGSYAGFATWSAQARGNYSWGAPFNSLAVHSDPPASSGNGTVGIPIGISFENHAPLDLDGLLALALRTAGGSVCGTGTLPISSTAHQSFAINATIYAPGNCAGELAGYEATWTGNGLSAALPGGSF